MKRHRMGFELSCEFSAYYKYINITHVYFFQCLLFFETVSSFTQTYYFHNDSNLSFTSNCVSYTIKNNLFIAIKTLHSVCSRHAYYRKSLLSAQQNSKTKL